ncbi:hypothetical protein [Actinomadura decatromicini]|uniref:Uncharacterized protein n=1 Tax=Actinomadura decatromicini TaxID=2604572 RepID=A0A5D3F6U6_9ACTN|nr:hypothetical protein [Actinomadura decatromicini]TYK43065.1 hypothetical protein FXF68_39995 [Actinomadura decatromicini]
MSGGTGLPEGATGADEARSEACHEMLLRLAARAPVPLVARARSLAARGRPGEMARAVTLAALQQRIPLTFEDVELLAELLEEAGADPAILAQAEQGGDRAALPYLFDARAGRPPDGDGGRDPDPAAVRWAAAEPGVIGLWRAWRVPADGAPWPPPRRVYVAEMAAADPVAVTGSLQDALAAAGEPEPSAEVYRTGRELPLYQRLARGHGELIWAADDAPVRVAGTFGEIDPETGPRYRDDHARIHDAAERDRLLAYLRSAAPLMITKARLDDVVDTARRAVVPMSFRTDGHWIWTDAVAYYLAEHRLSPDPGLVAHIRNRNYVPPVPDGVRMHRALQELLEPVGTADPSRSARGPGAHESPWAARPETRRNP